MVCYIDDRCIDYILEHYTRSPHSNKLFIPINHKWLEQNINAWKQLKRDQEIMKSPQYREMIEYRKTLAISKGASPNIQNAVFPENEIPEYNAINHAKIDFIIHAIQNGYINNKITCWCDFGYFGTQHQNDKATFPRNTLDSKMFSPDRITFFLQKEVNEHDADPVYTLICAPELFTGTFWGGPTELMEKMQTLYHESVEELYNMNISDDDQHIYLRCCLKNSDLFDLKLNASGKWPKGLLFFEKKN
jgi:hypothetical protein